MHSMANLDLRSVESVVYETLRDLIVHGDYKPGRRLHLAVLASELGVSTMPVRGAVSRLTDEGLVRSQPRRGATVAPLDIDEYQELQDLRIGIEGVAAHYGVVHMEEHRLQEMRQVLREMRNDLDLDTRLALEWDAYLALYRAPGRSRTIDLILEFARLTERYVRFALKFDLKRDDAAERLERVIAAIENGDADAVAKLVTDDLRFDAEKVSAALKREKLKHE